MLRHTRREPMPISYGAGVGMHVAGEVGGRPFAFFKRSYTTDLPKISLVYRRHADKARFDAVKTKELPLAQQLAAHYYAKQQTAARSSTNYTIRANSYDVGMITEDRAREKSARSEQYLIRQRKKYEFVKGTTAQRLLIAKIERPVISGYHRSARGKIFEFTENDNYSKSAVLFKFRNLISTMRNAEEVGAPGLKRFGKHTLFRRAKERTGRHILFCRTPRVVPTRVATCRPFQ
jgi:hypothetical protein